MILNRILNIDCMELLRRIPSDSIDLIITSPPYNKGFWSKNRNLNNGIGTKARRIDYGVYNDYMLPTDYYEWQCAFLKECLRVLKRTGSIFYNHKDLIFNKRIIFPEYVFSFDIREILIWDRKCTPVIGKEYFYPIHEYIFWITKSKDSKFYKHRIPIEYQKSILHINRETSNSHPAPFPIDIPKIFIKACSDEGDIVLDPFMGSGTTAVAAQNLNRNFLGSELNQEYINMANQRLGIPQIEPYIYLI